MTSVDGGIEMPSYNIRHSIATKVAAKKTAKGYTLSDESCDQCEMPLMTLNGKSECKVCPAIKKWVQRKNEANAQKKQADDAREAVETANKEAEIREEEEEEAPVEIIDIEDKPEVVVEIVDTVESKQSEAQSEVLQIDSNNSADKSEVLQIDSRNSNDSGSFVGRFASMNVSNSASMESEASSAQCYSMSKTDSDDSEDTDAIRARARQIILDARGRGEWGGADSNDEDEDDSDNGTSIKSYSQSWDDGKVSYSNEYEEDCMIQERAADIINRARKDLQAEQGSEFPPAAILSPRIDHDESAGFDVSPGMGSWEAATIIQAVARMFLAKKLVLGMLLRESEECQQDEDAAEETVEQASSEHFEPLGVINPTAGSEDWCVDKTDEAQKERGEDVVVEDVAQFDAQDVVPDDVDFDAQDATNSNPAVDNNGIADGQEPEVPDEAFENAMIPQPGPQQQEVFMSDYAAILEKQGGVPVPPTPNNIVAPNRGIFAHLACKFDDAVADAIGKVRSIVTCETVASANNGEEGAFGEAFEAEQNDIAANLSINGQVNYDPQGAPCQAKYEAQMMILTINGWKISNAPCNRCNQNFMVRPQDGQMVCAGCDTIETEPQPGALPAVNHAPPRPEYAVNHSPSRPEPDVSHSVPNQLYNIEMNRRIQMGWMAMNHGCPYCSSQLMRKPNDDTDHCLACGPIFSQPAQAVMTPSMPAVASYPTQAAMTPPMTAMASYTPLGANQNTNANPLRDVTAVHYGTVTEQPKSTVMPPMPMPPNPAHPAPSASSSARPPPPPPAQSAPRPIAPNPKQLMNIAPHPNQMMQMVQHTPSVDKWSQDVEAKENVSGDANISRQLEDAKLRIEDAKKFILSRNNRRPPSSATNHMVPVAVPFRPQMSMMTQGSQAGNFQPMMNMTPATQAGAPRSQMNVVGAHPVAQASPFRPQMNTVMTPGSARYRNHLEMKGSLMSPGSEPNAQQTAKVVDVMSPGTQTSAQASPGTQNSGYRTPQMPGKYFFA